MTLEDRAINMQKRLINNVDNCLLCRYSDIEPNQCARVFEKLGFHGIAKHIDAHFPLVFCDYPHSKRVEQGTRGKYVANPMSVPGWCPKKEQMRP